MNVADKMELVGSAQLSAREKVKVWDRFVRFFHWSLVASFIIAFVSAEQWDRLHEWIGYLAGGLIFLRLIWGLIGSRHARFRDFIKGPSAVFAYLRDMRKGRASRYLGHNPAGGAMVLALLLLIAILTLSGYAMITDQFWGVEWVGELHEALAWGIVAMVVVHVLGVIHASRAHDEKLILSMITGWKDKRSGDV